MTIRRRVNIAFAVILLMFAVGGIATAWSNRVRTESVEVLQRALTRQTLLTEVEDGLRSRRKQLALLGQTFVTGEEGGLGEDEVARFDVQLKQITVAAAKMRALTEQGNEAEIEAMRKGVVELSAAWLLIVRNYGVDHTKAIMHEATVADPLGETVMKELVPSLRRAENQRATAAHDRFDRASESADQTTIIVLLTSMLLALAVAFSLTRRLNTGIGALREGTLAIGDGELDHRIAAQGRDELSEVAVAVNAMAEKLQVSNTRLVRRNEDVEAERRVADSLLRNILPDRVATELQTVGEVKPRHFEAVSVLFTDFKGFSKSTAEMDAGVLVEHLDQYFTAFDRITQRYGLEKLKTIGDSYMLAGGLPAEKPGHEVDIVLAALEMVEDVRIRSSLPGAPPWQMRVGIHTGPVVAGVVGIQKFAFDVWGQTVNMASRMESSGVPNRVNISAATRDLVVEFFDFEDRGTIRTKDGDDVAMFLVEDVRMGLMPGRDSLLPPAKFVSRYREKFGGLPPSFPGMGQQMTTDMRQTAKKQRFRATLH